MIRWKKIDINPGQYDGNIVFGQGVYKSDAVLSIPVIYDFKIISIMDIDVNRKIQTGLKRVNIDLEYSQISDACLSSARKLYTVIRPGSNDELMMFDAATGKLKSVINLPLDKVQSVIISDVKRKGDSIFITGLSSADGDVYSNWVAKTGPANRIIGFYKKESGEKRILPPQFVESQKGIAIVNDRQEFSHNADLVLFNSTLKINSITDLDCSDRMFSPGSVYGLCEGTYLVVNRFKKNGTRNNLRLWVKNRTQLIEKIEILNTTSRIYNRAFVVKTDKEVLISANFTTISDDRRLRKGIGIKKIRLNKETGCE